MRLIVVAALLLVPASAGAQRLAPGFARLAEPWGSDPATMTVAVFGHPDDHRWEGVLVGGIAGGVGGVIVAVNMCDYHSDAPTGCMLGGGILALIIGGVLGGGLGGLIGGLIPKKQPTP